MIADVTQVIEAEKQDWASYNSHFLSKLPNVGTTGNGGVLTNPAQFSRPAAGRGAGPGPAGGRGPTGDTGAAGSNGADGNTILNGSGVPSGGGDGDYWIDNTSNTIYGPKASGTWPGSGTLMAASGFDLHGSGSPSSGDGSDGDVYMDLDNGDTYLKATGAWTLIGSIQGETGATGADGDDATLSAVTTLATDGNGTASGTYVDTELQAALDKIDEIITALTV